MKVYLISRYDEYGSEDVRATVDKDKVRELLRTHKLREEEDVPEDYDKTLSDLLAKDIATGQPNNLGRGWGGFQLHIVELE